MCRFHLTYAIPSPSLGQDTWDAEWDFEELMIGIAVNDAEIKEEEVTRHMELHKGIHMMFGLRDERYCNECEPLLIPNPWSSITCSCTVHSHLVKPWRCIPCVLAEETKLVSTQQKYMLEYNPRAQYRHQVYWRVRAMQNPLIQMCSC
jgi:hypothetical protein